MPMPLAMTASSLAPRRAAIVQCVGNTPGIMLLLPFLSGPSPNKPFAWYFLRPCTRFGKSRTGVQLLDHRFTHLVFLDLAACRGRKAVDKLDVSRNLVMGDLTAAERANLVGTGFDAVTTHDPGAQFLAIFGVRHADHLNLANGRVAV